MRKRLAFSVCSRAQGVVSGMVCALKATFCVTACSFASWATSVDGLGCCLTWAHVPPCAAAGVPRGGGRGSTIESGADSDGMEVACQTPEGSSVVWVQHADALGEEDARDAAGCFALLTAKVC
jgi:hypothetical protein